MLALVLSLILFVDAGTPKPMTTQERNTFLSLINAERARFGSSPLTWDEDLRLSAQSWSETCASLQEITNVNVRGFKRGKVQFSPEPIVLGQTISFEPATPPIATVVARWKDFESCWTCTNTSAWHQVPSPVGCLWYHRQMWTQILWSTTTKIGCGRTTCASGSFLVCDYDPVGNIPSPSPIAQLIAVSYCPVVNCRQSDPNAPTGCTKSCGGGTQTIQRNVLQYPSGGGTACVADESQPCNTHACAEPCVWGEWGPFIPFPGEPTCAGGGLQQRTQLFSGDCGPAPTVYQTWGKDPCPSPSNYHLVACVGSFTILPTHSRWAESGEESFHPDVCRSLCQSYGPQGMNGPNTHFGLRTHRSMRDTRPFYLDPAPASCFCFNEIPGPRMPLSNCCIQGAGTTPYLAGCLDRHSWAIGDTTAIYQLSTSGGTLPPEL